MPFIPLEEVARAKEIDLYSYLRANEPQELVHFGGSTYCTREHDSLKISNGKWYWFSRGIGGRFALDYLIKVKEIPFTEAVAMILGKTAMLPPMKAEPASPKPKALVLPPRSSGNTQAVSYLMGRGIDKEVIDFCIRTGRLYESAPYHNVVFVGMDAEGKAKYASLRGTGSDFKGEASGSDKHFSFSIPAKSESDVLHLFESAIDLLSYATLCKQEGIDWQRDHLLSLAGVYRPKAEQKESTMPMALTQYLKDHSGIRRIVLRLDNDYTGKLAAQTIHSMLREEYLVTFGPPPNGAKDVNELHEIMEGKRMKSNLRNEIKSYIVRQGMTMQEVVDLLRDEHGWSDSVSNLSNKLQRESMRYVEAVQLADALGYEIVWQKRR